MVPEHKLKPIVVIRVQEILSPITCLFPDYDLQIKRPRPGRLITKRKSDGKYHPWMIDLSEDNVFTAKALQLLFPDEIV
jgi:hypothetical protein